MRCFRKCQSFFYFTSVAYLKRKYIEQGGNISVRCTNKVFF